MSKEPTGNGRPESGNENSARRRRRRRGAGLRVPSDKVPRASSDHEAAHGDPPEPPTPEDPELAVSVASAFGGREDGDGAVDAEASPAAGDEADVVEADAAAAKVYEQGSDDAENVGGVGSAGDEAEAAGDLGDGETTTVAVSHRAEDAGETDQVAGVGENDAGVGQSLADADDDSEDADDQAREAGVAEKPDAAEHVSHAEPEAANLDAANPDAAEHAIHAEPKADSGDDHDSDGDHDSVDIPIDDGIPQRRMMRAQTEALTDQDLEELMEPLEEEEDDDDGEGGGEGGDNEGAALADGRGDDDFDAQETSQFVPVVIEEPEDRADQGAVEAPRRQRDAAPGVQPAAAAVAVRERGDVARVRDAGDSGELLSDELVEEIEDAHAGGAASPAAEGTPAVKPPPAPGVTADVAPASQGRPAQGKAWFDQIFDEDYLRTLPFLTPQSTQAEARFVADAIDASPGAQLLDVGCGYGRHAMELAARGFHVVGLDSSLPLLLRGADEAQRRGLTINFIHGDMRELTFDSQFDAAYCLFSTFGYFDDETNKKTAQNIARALKPGARFVVEILNRDYLIQDLPTRVWWEGDGCVVLEEVDFNYFSSRIVSNRSVVFDDGRQLEHEISIRAYALHELGKLLHAAGFRVLEVSGSMNTRGRFFGAKARDIIVVAEKRAASGG